MIRLIQVTDQAIIDHVINDLMVFKRSASELMLHALEVDNVEVGFIASEVFGHTVGPHLYVHPANRTSYYLTQITQIVHSIYVPLMKAIGKTKLVTCCDPTDKSTANCLRLIGFTLQDVTIAEMQL